MTDPTIPRVKCNVPSCGGPLIKFYNIDEPDERWFQCTRCMKYFKKKTKEG